MKWICNKLAARGWRVLLGFGLVGLLWGAVGQTMARADILDPTLIFDGNGNGYLQFGNATVINDPTANGSSTGKVLAFALPTVVGNTNTTVSGYVQTGEVDIYNSAATPALIAVLRFTDAAGNVTTGTGGNKVTYDDATQMLVYLPNSGGNLAGSTSNGFPTMTYGNSSSPYSVTYTDSGSAPNDGSFGPESFWYMVGTTGSTENTLPGEGPIVTGSGNTPTNPYTYVALVPGPVPQDLLPTPEPATITLVGMCLAGFAAYSWRRRTLLAA